MVTTGADGEAAETRAVERASEVWGEVPMVRKEKGWRSDLGSDTKLNTYVLL
jgi:hypothetical protein